jgi:hypothetical protein
MTLMLPLHRIQLNALVCNFEALAFCGPYAEFCESSWYRMLLEGRPRDQDRVPGAPQRVP